MLTHSTGCFKNHGSNQVTAIPNYHDSDAIIPNFLLSLAHFRIQVYGPDLFDNRDLK